MTLAGYSDRLTVELATNDPEPSLWDQSFIYGNFGLTATNLTQNSTYSKPGHWFIGGSLLYKQGGAWRLFWFPWNAAAGMDAWADNQWAPKGYIDVEGAHHAIQYTMALDKVPARLGEIVFAGMIAADQHPITTFSCVVRKAGEKIRHPVVSHYCPLVIDKVTVSSVYDNQATQVAVVVKERAPMRQSGGRELGSEIGNWGGPFLLAGKSIPRIPGRQERPYIMAANGVCYGMDGVPGTPWHGIHYDCTRCGGDPYNEREAYVAKYTFDPTEIPGSAGALIFKARLAVKDYWPVSITKVIRKGSSLVTPKSR